MRGSGSFRKPSSSGGTVHHSRDVFPRDKPARKSSRDREKLDQHRSMRKVSRSRSRSRSPGIKRSNFVVRDLPVSRDRDRGRSSSRDRHGPRRGSGSGGGSGGLGLIARAREQMKLASRGQLRMDAPAQSSRHRIEIPGTHDQERRNEERERGGLRKSLQDRIGGKN